jgi:DUF4097 and DUF4098 domain-containing protein YvlB
MITTMAVLTAATLLAATHTDTTFAVRPGARLEINNFGGDITVQTWTKNSVRIVADHSSRTVIEVDGEDPILQVHSANRHGIPTTVDYQLTVPRWMGLNLSGVNTDIQITGTEGSVEASSVQGDVEVSGPARSVKATSVEGDARVSGARGKVECSSVNADVSVDHVSGEVDASSVNGEVRLDHIESSDVEASTINGTVSFDGLIREGGSYRFSSHEGRVSVAIPEKTNASVSVSTFAGAFRSAFPIPLSQTKHGRTFNFTLGNGSAQIELESFQGSIELHRPGSTASDYRYQYDVRHKSKTKDKSHADDDNPDEER